jgi:hypothetical protein
VKHDHSKSYFWLFMFSFIAVAAFQIGWSGNSHAAVSGGDDDGFVLDGYESVKFGMDVIELKNRGYRCPNYSKTICRLDNGVKKSQTLLGKQAKLMVWVDDNEVRRIDVSVDIKPEDMLSHFTESYGEPETYRYRSLTNHLMEAYYWLSLDGSSVSLTRDFGNMATTTGAEVEKASSTMKYQNKERTLKSIYDIEQRELPVENMLIGHKEM